MIYDKPWVSFSDQLQILKDRGLMVSDDERALRYLERIGYCRLSGYWYAFRQRSGDYCPLNSHRKKGFTDRLALDEFKPGATFSMAVDLYVFDKRLRLLVLDALERIEIALRVDISHFLGKKDPFAYENPDLLFEGFRRHRQWLSCQNKLIEQSKEEFIRHHKQLYGVRLPIWIACEIWDFGTLSTLFSGMKESDQDAIAVKYGVKNGRQFASWLRGLNYLRNVCAHHSRLWNRNIVDQPKLTGRGEVIFVERFRGNPHALSRPFFLFCITQYLLMTINPSSSWWRRLREHMLSFPDLTGLELDLKSMGVIEGWDKWQW